MDIITMESRNPAFWNKFLVAMQKFQGSSEKDRKFWPTHVVLKADGVKMPDGDEIVWESAWKSVFLSMSYWSRFKHRKYRVWRDKNNIQDFGSIKEKTGKTTYGYLQIFGYAAILIGGEKKNPWPWGEVCNETAHIWAQEHGYLKMFDKDPSAVTPVNLDDMLRESGEFDLIEEKM